MSSLKTVIFRSIGDIILIQLFGLGLLNPFKSYSIDKEYNSFNGTFSIYMLVFILYLILYSIISILIYKKRREKLTMATEVIEDDEMMLSISGKAGIVGYLTMKIAGVLSLGVFIGINIFHELGIIKNNNNYNVGIYAIVTILTLSIASYLIKWILEYRKYQK